MAYIIGSDRSQVNLVMTSLEEIIELENPVRAIDAYVESQDLKNLGFKQFSGKQKGQSPYLRTDLLKLHIYGYLNKIRSSRKLEVEAKRNLELMWLVNSIKPDHGTIAKLVAENKTAFRKVLRELTLILKGWGLIDGEFVAIDGTKIRAQNSKRNCITESSLKKKMEYADEQIDFYLAEIEKSDPNETDSFKNKLKSNQKLKEGYQNQKRELDEEGLEQKTLTDKDARRMKNNGSLDICFNVQTVVDSKNYLVVDTEAVSDINDQNQLSNMALNARELLSKEDMTVLADTSYYNGVEIKKCIDENLKILIKKQKQTIKQKIMNIEKTVLFMTQRPMFICFLPFKN